jgi:hypothetical protein
LAGAAVGIEQPAEAHHAVQILADSPVSTTPRDSDPSRDHQLGLRPAVCRCCTCLPRDSNLRPDADAHEGPRAIARPPLSQNNPTHDRHTHTTDPDQPGRPTRQTPTRRWPSGNPACRRRHRKRPTPLPERKGRPLDHAPPSPTRPQHPAPPPVLNQPGPTPNRPELHHNPGADRDPISQPTTPCSRFAPADRAPTTAMPAGKITKQATQDRLHSRFRR